MRMCDLMCFQSCGILRWPLMNLSCMIDMFAKYLKGSLFTVHTCSTLQWKWYELLLHAFELPLEQRIQYNRHTTADCISHMIKCFDHFIDHHGNSNISWKVSGCVASCQVCKKELNSLTFSPCSGLHSKVVVLKDSSPDLSSVSHHGYSPIPHFLTFWNFAFVCFGWNQILKRIFTFQTFSCHIGRKIIILWRTVLTHNVW